MLNAICYMNIIILGQQGSGKGTQADFLAHEYGMIHIDMGKTLREVAKHDTPLGREIYDIQNITKTLVPSRILREVLHIKLGSIPREQGIVFDGVPRTMGQARYIEESLQELGRKIDKVFFINISGQESIRRISKRWICKECKTIFIMGKDLKKEDERCMQCGGEIMQRIDDTIDGIKKRLEVFEEETAPVINYYKEQGTLAEINGAQEIEKVSEDIIKIVKKL